ncbi:MAG TPA: hypothetical protein VEK79_02240 [Thermoanaerobaculia bacterium]|nr:hypothetical protein [Thermoanaerobaculia bacterium]
MKRFLLSLVAVLSATSASAATDNGTVSLTGTLESSLTIAITANIGASSGSGTSTVSVGLGTIAKSGAVPIAVVRTVQTTDWKVGALIGIVVSKANLNSSSYTLTAQLASSTPAGITWKLNDVALSHLSPITLTSAGVYAESLMPLWEVVIANSAAPTSINNTIHFTATSN